VLRPLRPPGIHVGAGGRDRGIAVADKEALTLVNWNILDSANREDMVSLS
jgi:hypothetical protein